MKPQSSHKANDGDRNRPHSSHHSDKYAGLTRNQIRRRKYREKKRRPKEAVNEGGAAIRFINHGQFKIYIHGDVHIRFNNVKFGHGQSSATSSKSGQGVKSHAIDKGTRQADPRPLRERNWNELTKNQRKSLKYRQKHRKPKEDKETSEPVNVVKKEVKEESGSNSQDRF
ncbi:unnamed protein product [Bursaphelenchus xylophilus]|uniref:(pine wood nematode) hypothetical protein n=1 Tax=Bursaphelenchus xylophilus TaxID=6326 RepID=A0A1I7SIJ0_BURXY|nr:unnamed protein product [Bursaphelenchus xylophilus]CAG9119238.1 unnamed protein product [Bursaphelenchus xylophilus]